MVRYYKNVNIFPRSPFCRPEIYTYKFQRHTCLNGFKRCSSLRFLSLPDYTALTVRDISFDVCIHTGPKESLIHQVESSTLSLMTGIIMSPSLGGSSQMMRKYKLVSEFSHPILGSAVENIVLDFQFFPVFQQSQYQGGFIIPLSA